MADERQSPENEDTLELGSDEAPELEQNGPDDEQDEGEGSDEETVLTFDDEGEQQDGDSGLIKHLRAELKKARSEAAEAKKSAPVETIIVGEKPTIAGCDYDEEKYEAELDAWKERKATVENQGKQSQEVEKRQREEMQGALDRYNQGKAKLGFSDYEDAEENVKASLNNEQQAIILLTSKEPDKIVYALGKNPERLAALAGTTNLAKFAYELANLEGKLKMGKRRKPPEPEKIERGSARVSHSDGDKRLKQLEKEADETGDRTKLAAYKYEQAHKKR